MDRPPGIQSAPDEEPTGYYAFFFVHPPGAPGEGEVLQTKIDRPGNGTWVDLPEDANRHPHTVAADGAVFLIMEIRERFPQATIVGPILIPINGSGSIESLSVYSPTPLWMNSPFDGLQRNPWLAIPYDQPRPGLRLMVVYDIYPADWGANPFNMSRPVVTININPTEARQLMSSERMVASVAAFKLARAQILNFEEPLASMTVEGINIVEWNPNSHQPQPEVTHFDLLRSENAG